MELNQKPPVAHLLENVSTFYGTWNFITQELIIGPNLEPDQSSPYHPILCLWHPLWYYLTTYFLSFHSGAFPFGIPIKILYAFLFSPFVLHALPTSSSLTWSYLAKSTSYEAPHYEVFFQLCITSHLSRIQIFSSAPCYQTPSVYTPPLMSETKFCTHIDLWGNYSSEYFFNLYVSRLQTCREKVLNSITDALMEVSDTENVQVTFVVRTSTCIIIIIIRLLDKVFRNLRWRCARAVW
jgi:hypothetical protein